MSDFTERDPDALEDFEEEGEPGEFDIEAPEADAAEQHLDVRQRRDEPLTDLEMDEVDPADAAEQHRVVDLDEDDYR